MCCRRMMRSWRLLLRSWRATASRDWARSGFQVGVVAIFATVSQQAIRNVALGVYRHLHALDHAFHLDRNVGQLSRALDRSGR